MEEDKMGIKEDLDVYLITFNRKEKLRQTLEKLSSVESPLRGFEIKILDNDSTDGTAELCQEYCAKNPDWKYIKNHRNLGISGNIIKAMELACKKWLWVLCDDDDFDFSVWPEIETALQSETEYDVVHTTYTVGFRNETYPYLINEEAFIPTAIYNTKHLTPLTMNNAYAMAYTLLPHHAIGCKVINENGKIFVPQGRFVQQGYDDKCNFIRLSKKGLYHRLDNYQLLAGYISAYALIEDEKTRSEVMNVLCLGSSFKASMGWFIDSLPRGDLLWFLDVLALCNEDQRNDLKNVFLTNASPELCEKVVAFFNIWKKDFKVPAYEYYRIRFLHLFTFGKKKAHYKKKLKKLKEIRRQTRRK